jgi:hypothetical protein
VAAIDSLPGFWQGVLASILAGLILTVAAFVFRIAFASVREWMAHRRGAVAVLRQQLSSDHPTIRSEATLQVLFGAAKWLIIAAILYAFSSTTVPAMPSLAIALFRILSLACLVASLWWLFQYQQPAKSTPEEWGELLTSRRWVLVFNPPHRLKPITFLPNGAIGEGRNSNENSWRIAAGKLELVQADGRTHSRFDFNPRNTSFLHTNDPDTLSIRGQYIVPASSLG